MKWNWGTAIAAVYITFALATTTFVTFAMGRSVDLVRADYYAESLRQDEHLQAIDNAFRLGTAVAITDGTGADDRSIEIVLPPAQRRTARGTITLYRPSDAAADRRIDLSIDPEGRQRVTMPAGAPGLWVVQLAWTAEGREFYLERAVTIP